MGQRFPLGGWASGPLWLAVKAKGELSDSSEVVSGAQARIQWRVRVRLDPRLREDDVVIGVANLGYPSTGAGASSVA